MKHRKNEAGIATLTAVAYLLIAATFGYVAKEEIKEVGTKTVEVVESLADKVTGNDSE